MSYVIEVVGEQYSATGWDQTDEMLYAIAQAERLTVVPLPPHAGQGRYIAYCDADASRHKPNCRVDGYPHPIHGPLVIVGVDEDGEHRPLSYREVDVFGIVGPGPDGLYTLVTR